MWKIEWDKRVRVEATLAALMSERSGTVERLIGSIEKVVSEL